MHVLSASNISQSFDDRELFADLSFGLTTNDHVAIVGPNGCGKSTLLKIIAGELEPSAGEVVTRRNLTMSVLEQDPSYPDQARAIDVVADEPGARTHEAAALLDRLSIPEDALVSDLSGGQRRRVALAAALIRPSDLLILDEPTNHLDAESIDWLEEQLRRRAGGLVFITHDRYLLERLTNRMLDLNDVPTWIEGSYGDVIEARMQRSDARDRMEQLRQNRLRKELAWLRRQPKARTSKSNFRLEQAHALLAVTPEQQAAELNLGTGRRRLGTQVLDAHDLVVRFGDNVVLDEVDLAVGPGERVGIVGRNGAGKTTLLRALTGEQPVDAGAVRWGTTVELGMYEQQATAAPTEVNVLDTITEIAPWIPLANGDHLTASALAERFGFDGSLQRASVATLSGGERRRLALLHMLIAAPNVLMLDEPTNDLDIDTLQRLEDHLDGFAGTLIVASHDRYVLERLTDRLIAVQGGRLVEYPNWDAYRKAESRPAADAAPPVTEDAAGNRERQERRRLVRSLEQRLERLQAQRKALAQTLAAAGTDYARASELGRAMRHVEGELAAAEDEWLTASMD